MNITKCKRWLNCFLAVILIISGMCFETIKMDSSSLYAVNSTGTCSFYQPKNTDINHDICTPEQIKTTSLRGTVERLSRNSFANKGRTGLRTGIFLTTLNILSENSNFYFIDAYNRANRTFSSYEAVIISYIHRQDGAKG